MFTDFETTRCSDDCVPTLALNEAVRELATSTLRAIENAVSSEQRNNCKEQR
jgi:hypothetical protein